MKPSDTVAKQRQIQDRVAAADSKERGETEEKPMQAGARVYPVPPFAAQHQRKPGEEMALDPAPMCDAPYYRGSEKLKGKVAIITGGDSGIGRAVAVLFAREGADVVITHLAEEEDAMETMDAVREEGRRCLALKGDVKSRDFCNMVAKKAAEDFGRLDILVNNAAFQVHSHRIEDLGDDHFDETLKTNLYGYFYMAKACIPYMKNGAAVINTGSITGIDGSKSLLDYSMTKGGIHAFTRSLAAQLIAKGIRVNAVAPGPVWTPLNPSDKTAEDVANFGSSSIMKRPAQPEEIAPAYVFLASSHCSSYITGEILPVIGGY